MEERLPRKLAAILYADVAGYSRLTGEDEEGTHRHLSECLNLISASIEQHEGRVVHYAGDAILADFDTVTAALTCATAVQRDLQYRNSELPDDRKIRFRIGVNLGEVIVDRNDIYGEGVNVAARLESLAEPGGICISESVHSAISNKLPFDYEFMGERSVKNIARPVRAYRVLTDASVKPSDTSKRGAREFPDKPSIAVLSFQNLSGDPEQEYFSDGITEDIITDLSKISALFVIARNSSFAYKGRAVDVKEVAKDLGVRYVLEGSVRKAGNRVRITAQLIDGVTGGHLWADRYDRDLHDIFLVQDDVTQNIVAGLKVRLSPDEQDRIGRASTSNVEAYDFALRGRELLLRFTANANVEAKALFEKAIELDSKFSAAYSMLAVTLLTDYINNWNDDKGETLEGALRLAMRAVELDPDDSQGYWALALAYMWGKRDLERAIAEMEKAVTLDPNNSHALASRGHILSFAGRATEAIEDLETSMRLDPHYPHLHLHFLAHAHFVQGNYAEAVALLKRRIRLHPETDASRVLLASCCGHLGRGDEAKEAWAEAMRVNPNYSLERKARILPYKNPEDWKRLVDGLRKAGLPE